MMDKEELFDALIDMDVDVCVALNDPEGKNEVMEILRKYEKVIMKICGLEEIFAKYLSLPVDVVKASVNRAYDEWKNEGGEIDDESE